MPDRPQKVPGVEPTPLKTFPLLLALSLGVGVGLGVGLLSRKGVPPPSAEARLTGFIDIRPELKSRVAPGDTLFIIVTKSGESVPLAVKRVVLVTVPFLYAIGPEHRMIPDRPFQGPVELTVRVDKDGQANSPQPGDLIGKAPGGPFFPPQDGVHVLIDQLVS